MSIRKRILIIYAHPAPQKSRVNRRMAQEVRGLSGVTFHDLYEAYPDLDIDPRREQELLLAHDLILFQHPFYWYSTPAILKEWADLVLEYGFAYGEGGTALREKGWVHALTAGGAEHAYQADGSNRFTVRQLLAPMDQTAYLCGMRFLPPFVVHGTLRLDPKTDIPRVASQYRRYVEILQRFAGGWETVPAWESANSHLDELESLGGSR